MRFRTSNFQIEPWVKAARPNDDAELARESVLEGSAMAGMLDYTLRDKGLKLRELPDIDPEIFVGDLSATPMLKKAPPFIKDSLMFPYFSGLTFSMSILKADGWNGFAGVFAGRLRIRSRSCTRSCTVREKWRRQSSWNCRRIFPASRGCCWKKTIWASSAGKRF